MNFTPEAIDAVSEYIQIKGIPEKNTRLNEIILQEYSSIDSQLPAYLIFDFSGMAILFASENIEWVMGYTAKEFIEGNMPFVAGIIHPDDNERIQDANRDLFAFYYSLPEEERHHYKYYVDGRYRKKDGNYIWIILDINYVAFDEKNRPVLAVLFTTNISHMKKDELINLNIIRCNNDLKTYPELVKTYPLNNIPTLTKREKELLKLIGEGFSTKQIANKLNLSLYTVSTHRQNMLQKTHTSNMSELLNKAGNWGLI